MLVLQNKRIRLIVEIAIFGMFWVLVYIASTLLTSPLQAALNSTVHTALMAATFYVVRTIQHQIRQHGNALLWWTGIVLGSFGLIYLKVLLTDWAFYTQTNFGDFILGRLRNSPMVPIVSVWAPILGAIAYDAVEHHYEKQQRALQLINELQRSQLSFLKAQINPHFLFNTLNNIYALAVAQSPHTPEMVLRLSEILRYAIYDGEKSQVSLEKEVEQLKKLIELFQMRSREVMQIELEVDGSMDGIMVEPMLLVPLVENAIKHGDWGRNPKAFARFHLGLENHRMRFEAENTYSKNGQKDEVGGVGLKNIKERLSIRHPGKHIMEIKDQPPLFKVNLEIRYGN